MKYHKKWKRLPNWIRWLFFNCSDCGVKLRNAKSGKGSGVPHFIYKSYPNGMKCTTYKCLDCEMYYDD